MKSFVFMIGLVFFLSLNISANAEVYFTVGGGGGGAAKAGNMSVDIGQIESDHFLGIGLGVIKSNKTPSGTLDYPYPLYGNDYNEMGKMQNDDEYVAVFKYGIEVSDSSGFYLFGEAGASFYKESEIVQSNATGWYYTQSSDTKANGVIGGGLLFHPQNHSIIFQIEYDNRRGITGSIGNLW